MFYGACDKTSQTKKEDFFMNHTEKTANNDQSAVTTVTPPSKLRAYFADHCIASAVTATGVIFGALTAWSGASVAGEALTRSGVGALLGATAGCTIGIATGVGMAGWKIDHTDYGQLFALNYIVGYSVFGFAIGGFTGAVLGSTVGATSAFLEANPVATLSTIAAAVVTTFGIFANKVAVDDARDELKNAQKQHATTSSKLNN